MLIFAGIIIDRKKQTGLGHQNKEGFSLINLYLS